MNSNQKSTARSLRSLMPIASLLALAGAASSADAQEVIMYGRVTAGLDYQNNVLSAGGSTGKLVRVDGNQWGTSMWGLKGTEDLGSGLKAYFLLESGFDATTGRFNSSTNAIFNRRAYVGLKTAELGSLQFGKNLATSNDVYYLDPTGQQFISTATLVHGRNWQGADNVIEYTTPTWGGFGATAQTSLGESTNGLRASRKDALSLVYTVGGYELRGIYDVARDANGQYTNVFSFSKELTLGGTAVFGDAKLFLGYERLSAPQAPAGDPDRVNHYWAGINYQVTAPLTLIGAVFRANVNNNGGRGTLYMAGANYNLSKRTLVYAAIGHVSNSATSNFSVEATDNSPPVGEGQSGGYFGFAHSF